MTGKADGYQYHFRYKKGCEEENYHLTASVGKLLVRAIEKAESFTKRFKPFLSFNVQI